MTTTALGMGSLLLNPGHAPTGQGSPQATGNPLRGRKPNILFILADDMGYGDIGAFNFGASETPVLDQLLREGTALTQHYAGSAVCTPSRACLLTGRYPQRTGAADTLPTSPVHLLGLRETTIAETLAEAGYVTGMIGKWHLGWDEDARYRPQNRGFQETVALERNSYWDWVLDYSGKRQESSDGRYQADVLNEHAIEFIRRHRKEPFFLYLAHKVPHAPLEAPEEDIQVFRDKGLSENLSRIYAMIRRMDSGLAGVFQELKDQGLEDDTLVIFTSDNGPQFGTSWNDRTSLARYNCGLAGHKDLVYEGGIRVPAILRWPAALPAGELQHDMTHFADWFPTLLEFAGAEVPSQLSIDGQSMVGLLQGEKNIIAPRRYWQFSRYFPTAHHNAAVRDGDWKLVRPCADDVTGPILGVIPPKGIAEPTHDWNGEGYYQPELPATLPPQLFNLRSDPGEQTNLAASESERLERMNRDLDRWFDSVMKDLHQAIPPAS